MRTPPENGVLSSHEIHVFIEYLVTLVENSRIQFYSKNPIKMTRERMEVSMDQ